MVPLEPYSEYYYEWIHILNYTSITTPHTREATVTYISTKKKQDGVQVQMVDKPETILYKYTKRQFKE